MLRQKREIQQLLFKSWSYQRFLNEKWSLLTHFKSTFYYNHPENFTYRFPDVFRENKLKPWFEMGYCTQKVDRYLFSHSVNLE